MQLSRIHKWPRAALDWLCAGHGAYWEHCARQRGRRYQAMRRVCKSVWIGGGVLMLVNPVVEFLLFIALVATFLSLALMDESDYMRDGNGT